MDNHIGSLAPHNIYINGPPVPYQHAQSHTTPHKMHDKIQEVKRSSNLEESKICATFWRTSTSMWEHYGLIWRGQCSYGICSTTHKLPIDVNLTRIGAPCRPIQSIVWGFFLHREMVKIGLLLHTRLRLRCSWRWARSDTS